MSCLFLLSVSKSYREAKVQYDFVVFVLHAYTRIAFRREQCVTVGLRFLNRHFWTTHFEMKQRFRLAISTEVRNLTMS